MTQTLVTPWTVESEGEINYMQLIEKFGTEPMSIDLIDDFRRVTGHEPHPWLKRGVFFSHRDIGSFLRAFEQKRPVFLYTGRGPTSDAMHIGHMIPFIFTKWLQDVFKCPLVIQIADDEKAYFKKRDFNEIYKLGFQNAKDIIAFGFDPKLTFIFSNRDYRIKQCQNYEQFASKVIGSVSRKTISDIFGLDKEEGKPPASMGMYMWPIYQSIAAFSKSFPHIFNGTPATCLVAYAIDQDPYFRLARDIATTEKLPKPCSIMSTFLDPLVGPGKMSSSVGQESTIFLTDDQETIRRKIKKYAFSGSKGNGTAEEHRKFGGDITKDISAKYLKYFELDETLYNNTINKFKKGELLCGEMKEIMADKIAGLIAVHQERRKSVTDEMLSSFYEMKPMDMPERNIEKTAEEETLYRHLNSHPIPYETYYHNPITTMEEGEELVEKLKGMPCKNLLLQANDMFFLYITHTYHSKIDINAIGKNLGVGKMKKADANQMQNLLSVGPGCLTPFALLNDREKRISVIINDKLLEEEYLAFHPLRNDATTTISFKDTLKFLQTLSYSYMVESELVDCTKSFWDNNAAAYSDQELTKHGSEFVLTTVKNYCTDVEKLICFGCADGKQDPLSIITNTPAEIHCHDLSDKMLEQAKKNLSHLTCRKHFTQECVKGVRNDSTIFMSVFDIASLDQVTKSLYTSNNKIIGTNLVVIELRFDGDRIVYSRKDMQSVANLKVDDQVDGICLISNTGFQTTYFNKDKFKAFLESKFKQEITLHREENNRNLLFQIGNGRKEVVTILNNVFGNVFYQHQNKLLDNLQA